MGNKLYVQNLTANDNSYELASMFTTVGDVENSRIQTITRGTSELRVGYVEMANEQQAIDCIDRFNGQMRNGMVLIVREDKPHVPNPDFQSKKAIRTSAPKKKSKK